VSTFSDPSQFQNGERIEELPRRVQDAVKQAKPAKSIVDPIVAQATFEAAMRARNIIVPEGGIIADGKIHRCNAEGKNGQRDAQLTCFTSTVSRRAVSRTGRTGTAGKIGYSPARPAR
jgi:hypothetical protein